MEAGSLRRTAAQFVPWLGLAAVWAVIQMWIWSGPMVGQTWYRADPIPLRTLQATDTQGRAVDSTTWKGRVALVNVWATWCSPCRSELPDLVYLADQFGDDLAVIGLSIDSESGDGVERFAQLYGVTYPIVMANKELLELLPTTSGVPVTLIIDRAGRIVRIHQGRIDRDVIEKQVRYLTGM